MRTLPLKTVLFSIISLFCLLSFISCKKSDPVPNYSNFKITKVEVNAIPAYDPDGYEWDIGGYPDVYFNMEDVNNNILFEGSGSKIFDVTQFPVAWDFITAYQITNTSVTQYVTVYDYDAATADELIGYVGFKMDDYKSGYQTIISKSNGSLRVTITGVWF